MEPAISIKDLLVNQGGNFSLSIDRLDLLPHHIYALTGPNGAGKTTLLRIMALLITPQRGSIRIAGADGTSLTRQRRKVTLVEQSPYLLAGNVSDNLSFGLRLRGIRGKEQVERIDATLELVGLAGFAERKADKLSAGEVQRVALARGLVLQPEVLLLDEPTSNIDSKSLQSFETLLKSLPGYGVTVVFSTHDLAQPGRLDSEMLRIEHGRLLDRCQKL
jgi:tungstate transport system ATP-binding protein